MNSDAEDRLALRELYDAYQLAIDTHEAGPWVELFTSDGVYESPFGAATGTDELVAAISQRHSSGITVGKRHLLGPVSVTVDGNSATGHGTYFILEAEASAGVVASGTYRDQFVRNAEGWRIARRVQTIDPSFPLGG